MGRTQNQAKKAVDVGYWHLWRYNPMLNGEGVNPFKLECPAPKESFRDFLLGEVRYTTLQNSFPELADELFEEAEKDAKERYQTYLRMSKMEY
jgi:pyruvate-ferredoxin/flavodoxin oxidoreductase